MKDVLYSKLSTLCNALQTSLFKTTVEQHNSQEVGILLKGDGTGTEAALDCIFLVW